MSTKTKKGFTVIAMAPMAHMLFVVLPFIKKYGRTKMIILGSAIVFVGTLIALGMRGKCLAWSARGLA